MPNPGAVNGTLANPFSKAFFRLLFLPDYPTRHYLMNGAPMQGNFCVAAAQCTLAMNETGLPAKCIAIATPFLLHNHQSFLFQVIRPKWQDQDG